MSTAKSISVANAVSKAIEPAERHSREAALSSAELLHTMLAQHKAGGFDDTIGLSAIAYAARAASLAVEAREAHIRAHGALNLDLKRIGLDEMFSKTGPLPPNGPDEAKVFTTILQASESVTAR